MKYNFWVLLFFLLCFSSNLVVAAENAIEIILTIKATKENISAVKTIKIYLSYEDLKQYFGVEGFSSTKSNFFSERRLRKVFALAGDLITEFLFVYVGECIPDLILSVIPAFSELFILDLKAADFFVDDVSKYITLSVST